MKKYIIALILLVGATQVVGINNIKSKGTINYEIQDNGYNIMIVNKDRSLERDFVPQDLVEVNIPFHSDATVEEKLVSREIVNPLIEMVEEARNRGIELRGLSGYRSYETQKGLFKNSIDINGMEYTRQYVAKAGKSEHQLGVAMDIATEHGFIMEGTEEALWLEDNAYKYGFVIRYPKGKEEITGYNYEPWHVRYVGKELAQRLFEENLVLEEILL